MKKIQKTGSTNQRHKTGRLKHTHTGWFKKNGTKFMAP